MTAVAARRSVMTLFSDPQSLHSHRVRLVLAEKNVSCDIVDVDPLNLPEDVMDLNPYGTAPTLVDRELALYDSRIICEYLDERFPHPPLLPVDPVSRASARLYMFRVENDWYSLVGQILAGGKPATKARKELREGLTAAAPILAHKPFFMSDEFSLVDASIAPLLWRLPSLGVELSGMAAKQVNTYAGSMFLRNGFIASLTEIEREMRG
ncbi:MAG: glutathione S-transferase N-terminal domain-containing protein [Gammaproteobacteria bacterium]|nr:glutathione S-transferase N-terminal domain-containing protein [Gammaproteobacteria bacterium]